MSELTLEQALILLDESRQHNAAMLDRLYESLGIDSSDGEIRFKWAMIAIEDVKRERNELLTKASKLEACGDAAISRIKELTAERDAALAQNAELVAHSNVLKQQFELALDMLEKYLLRDDHLTGDDASDFAEFQHHLESTPTQCLRDVKAEAVENAANLLRFAPVEGGQRWALRHAARVKAGVV